MLLKEIEERKKASKRSGKSGDIDDAEWEDVDEHEKEVFATTGYFDIPDSDAHISAADQKLLEKMEQRQVFTNPKKASDAGDGTKDLAAMIMQKMETGDFIDGDKFDSMTDMEKGSGLDPKVVAAYKKVGIVMRSFKSGKVPKAFKIIPQTQNWEELLILTNPESWSAHSSYEATKIFCSQLNAKMTQRFYNVILLPNVQNNILKYKKLNYHLYMAVKKAMFKTGAFFKGFLLPLAENASTREAIIIGSIL
jgi:essential nuclear protein 1